MVFNRICWQVAPGIPKFSFGISSGHSSQCLLDQNHKYHLFYCKKKISNCYVFFCFIAWRADSLRCLESQSWTYSSVGLPKPIFDLGLAQDRRTDNKNRRIWISGVEGIVLASGTGDLALLGFRRWSQSNSAIVGFAIRPKPCLTTWRPSKVCDTW